MISSQSRRHGVCFSLLPSVTDSGELDAVSSAVSIDEKRKKNVDFTNGYFIAYYTVMTIDGSGITDQASLEGQKVGVLQGTFQDKWATENFEGAEIVRFTDHNLTFAALKNGTIDAQFFDLAVANEYVADNPDMNLLFAFDVPAEESPHGFPVKKGNDALREALNGALAAAIADGTYRRSSSSTSPASRSTTGSRPKTSRRRGSHPAATLLFSEQTDLSDTP